MARTGSLIRKAFTSVTLLVSLFIIFGLIIFFINNPQTFERTRTVLSLVFDGLYVGSLATLVGKKIKKHYAEQGSFSGAVMKFMESEPLFIALLFVFNVVVIVSFSYMLPLHYISVRVIDRADLSILGTALIEEKCIEMDGKRYELQPAGGTDAVYRSARFLVWGDSASVRIGARGYGEYESFVAWSGIPFLDLVGGNTFDADLLRDEPMKITLSVSGKPASSIHVIEPVDTTFAGAGVLYAKAGEIVRLKASHPGCAAWESTFVAVDDAELDITLENLPGRVLIRAFNEGGVEIPGMDIYINGNLIGEKSGAVIALAPGSYRVKMSKVLSGSERAVVDEFTIGVDAGGGVREISRSARTEQY